MKLIWTIVLVLACIAGYGQEGDLPEDVESAFKARYQNARMGDWWMDDQSYYLDFTLQGGDYIAVFNRQGSWLETAETISEMDIPAALKEYIRSSYPSGTICFCEKVETSGRQQFLRVTLIDEGNVDRIIKADLDGSNILILDPDLQ